MAPNVKGKRGCVCSVDEESSPNGNGHTHRQRTESPPVDRQRRMAALQAAPPSLERQSTPPRTALRVPRSTPPPASPAVPRTLPQATTAGMYGTLTRELVRGHSEGTARGYGRVPG